MLRSEDNSTTVVIHESIFMNYESETNIKTVLLSISVMSKESEMPEEETAAFVSHLEQKNRNKNREHVNSLSLSWVGIFLTVNQSHEKKSLKCVCPSLRTF